MKMANASDLAVVVPELGYGLKRLSECYQVWRWDAGGVNTRGSRVGETREAKWLAMECYPHTLEFGLQKIAEYAAADRLKGADVKKTLATIAEIVEVLERIRVA